MFRASRTRWGDLWDRVAGAHWRLTRVTVANTSTREPLPCDVSACMCSQPFLDAGVTCTGTRLQTDVGVHMSRCGQFKEHTSCGSVEGEMINIMGTCKLIPTQTGDCCFSSSCACR